MNTILGNVQFFILSLTFLKRNISLVPGGSCTCMAHVCILISFDSSYFLTLICLEHYTSRVFFHIYFYKHFLGASQMEAVC